MKRRIEDTIGLWFADWIEYVAGRPVRVAVACAVLSLGFALLTVTTLGVNLDNKRMLADDLPFVLTANAFQRYFPSLDDSILVVIDAPTPELARESAARLSARLAENTEVFKDVHFPAGNTFFERHALLYRTPAELDDLTDHVAAMQPVLAELGIDPSIATLANLVRVGLEHMDEEQLDERQWAALLDRIADGTVRVYDEFPVSISWQEMVLTGSAFDPGKRQVIVAEPVLEFDKLLAAEAAMELIRRAARELELSPERGVRVRITGNPALNYEEMLGLAWDVGVSSLGSFLLVTGILLLAFRSMRLVLAAAVTLLTGLLWTAGFAAVAVQQLNLLSITFGVLFVGLGVDFLIHLGMSYADAVRGGLSNVPALRQAAQEVSGALFVCALTTAIGFFAFAPTDYKGIAELGIIAGAGMFVILALSTTLFPALIALLLNEARMRSLRSAPGLHLAPPRVVATHPGSVVLVSALVLLVALTILPRIRFDVNIIALRNPATDSVQAFNDLLKHSQTSPWYTDVMTPSLAEAQAISERLRQLTVVSSTLTVDDYVPEQQEEKLEILADAAFLLDTPSGSPAPRVPIPVEQQVEALRRLHRTLSAPSLQEKSAPLAGSAHQLRDVLGRFLTDIAGMQDARPQLAELEKVLLGRLPDQLKRLRLALDPGPVGPETLPAEIRTRMLADDGHARVQVFPKENLAEQAALTRFVDEVRGIAPDATGVAVNIVEFGRTTVGSLRQAFLYALAAIALVLWLLQGRLDETCLVLAPVLLGGVLTGAAMVLLDVPFNFANVVVLPLLLGVGVDSGIHLVYRAREVGTDERLLLETTTARAVFYSAATTIASFASLATSGHRGISSLGIVLVCSMILTLAANLIFLPALLAWRTNRNNA